MKFFYLLFLFLFFLFQTPGFAKDVVQNGNVAISGKISAYSNGLILIEKNGVTHSIVRKMNANTYNDYIVYRAHPLKINKTQTYCKIIFIDNFHIIFETKKSRIEIPRYRVSSLIINAN